MITRDGDLGQQALLWYTQPMSLIHLYTRMIPGPGDKANEYPFKLRHVDSLEYLSGNEKNRQEMVAQILYQNGVEPGREYEGQLWRITDEPDNEGYHSILGWMCGWNWSVWQPPPIFSQEDLDDEGMLIDLFESTHKYASVAASTECVRSVLSSLSTRYADLESCLSILDSYLSGRPVPNEQVGKAARYCSSQVGDLPSGHERRAALRMMSEALLVIDRSTGDFWTYASLVVVDSIFTIGKREVNSIFRRCLLMNP